MGGKRSLHRGFAFVLILLLGLSLWSGGCGKGTDGGQKPAFDLAEHFTEPRLYEYARKMIGTKVPDVALTDLAGAPVTPATFAGKPVILEFSRTTCPYCVRVQPVIHEAALAWPEIAFVQVFPGETAADITAFLAESGITTAPVSTILTGDEPDAIRKQFGHYPFVPLFLFIDGDGTIVYMQGGALKPDELDAAIAFAFPEVAEGRS